MAGTRTKDGKRSLFEAIVADLLKRKKVEFTYEEHRVDFVTPPKKHYYKPDFHITKTGFFIETKGRFTAQDRKKHKLVKEQHPDLKIGILFQRSDNTLTKNSTTTYGEWCTKNEIPWADSRDGIPREWTHGPK